MNATAFDAIARGATNGLSRRNSVLALGGAALAATFAGAATASAGKAGKKAKKKCKKQVAPCQEFAQDLCALFLPPGADRDNCVAAASDCCSPLSRCQGGPFFDCALQVVVDITVN